MSKRRGSSILTVDPGHGGPVLGQEMTGWHQFNFSIFTMVRICEWSINYTGQVPSELRGLIVDKLDENGIKGTKRK